MYHTLSREPVLIINSVAHRYLASEGHAGTVDEYCNISVNVYRRPGSRALIELKDL
jgi:hypothetical protein